MNNDPTRTARPDAKARSGFAVRPHARPVTRPAAPERPRVPVSTPESGLPGDAPSNIVLGCLSAESVILVASIAIVATLASAHVANRSDWYLAHGVVLAVLAARAGVRLLASALDPRRRDGELVTNPHNYRCAIAAGAIALVCGLPLLAVRGPAVVGLTLVALALAWAHESGFASRVLRLRSDGVAVFGFTALGVPSLFFVQSGAWAPEAWIAGLQLGLLAATLPGIRAMRDYPDAPDGAPTLTDRFGPVFGIHAIALACVLPFGLGACWLAANVWTAAALPLLSLPVAVWIIHGVWGREPGQYHNVFLPRAIALVAYFSALLGLGFAVA